MKISIFPLLLLMVFTFASCQKEGSKDDTKLVKDDSKWEDKANCFGFVYPISYTMPDGSTVTGADEDAVHAALKAWYTANPNSKDKYILTYPVDVIFEDGKALSVTNEEKMIALKKGCEGKEDKTDCFALVYPIGYTMPDGSTVTGADEDAVNTALKAWYTANPNSKDKYTLVYPVMITFEDGSMQTMSDDADFETVKKDCASKDG